MSLPPAAMDLEPAPAAVPAQGPFTMGAPPHFALRSSFSETALSTLAAHVHPSVPFSGAPASAFHFQAPIAPPVAPSLPDRPLTQAPLRLCATLAQDDSAVSRGERPFRHIGGNMYSNGKDLHVCDFSCKFATYSADRGYYICALSGQPSRTFQSDRKRRDSGESDISASSKRR